MDFSSYDMAQAAAIRFFSYFRSIILLSGVIITGSGYKRDTKDKDKAEYSSFSEHTLSYKRIPITSYQTPPVS